jgi:ATP-dependent protease HslVU (ClpYQ) ATPase subunit
MVELDVTGIGFVDRKGAAMVRSLVEKGVRLVGTRALVEALLRRTAT